MNFNINFGPFDELVKSSATALLVCIMVLIAFALDAWPKFPSKLMPWVGVLLGGGLYPHLQRPERVPPDIANPTLALVLCGAGLAALAVVLHKVLIKEVLKRTWPAGVPAPEFLQETKTNKINEPNNNQETGNQTK